MLRKHVLLNLLGFPRQPNMNCSGGNGQACVWHDTLGMLVLGALIFGFSVLRFRRLLG